MRDRRDLKVRKMLTAAAVAAALVLTAGPALANCFDQMMADTKQTVAKAEQKGDTKAVDEGKAALAEAKRLYDAGKQSDAYIRIVRYMEKVNERGGQ
jgi:hypothetical protein